MRHNSIIGQNQYGTIESKKERCASFEPDHFSGPVLYFFVSSVRLPASSFSFFTSLPKKEPGTVLVRHHPAHFQFYPSLEASPLVALGLLLLRRAR
jgi:hypothetical protein